MHFQKHMQITQTNIQKLINEGEHQQQDFKFAISDAKKIARSLVAFANTDGGRLLIGVKDNGKIAGIKTEEEVHMIETAALLYAKPEVNFQKQALHVEGKHILIINVEPSPDKPHYAPDKQGKWQAYIRIQDENQIANKVLTKAMEQEQNGDGLLLTFTEAENVLLQFIEAHGWVSFLKAQRLTRLSRTKTENLLATFISMNLIEPVFHNNRITYQLRAGGNFSPNSDTA